MQVCGDSGTCEKPPHFHGCARALHNNKDLAQEHTGAEFETNVHAGLGRGPGRARISPTYQALDAVVSKGR